MNESLLPILIVVLGTCLALTFYFSQGNGSDDGDKKRTVQQLENKISLSVSDGIKFGFGFSIGVFCASILFMLVGLGLLGFSLSKILPNMF